MELFKQVLMDKLLRVGILEIAGTPIEECSHGELNDEWQRYELQRNKRKRNER